MKKGKESMETPRAGVPEAPEAPEILSAPDIVLTTDAELLEKLKRKSAEYWERTVYQAPEVDWHATYKAEILKELLGKGTVNVQEMMQKLKKRFSDFDIPAFNDAYTLISKYNSNDLEKVRGGTGLK